MDESKAAKEQQFISLSESLTEALLPFGFQRVSRLAETDGWIGLDHHAALTSSDLAKLAGADAKIAITVNVEGFDPSISLKDFDNVRETAFIRAVKSEIHRICAAQGIAVGEFERLRDFIYY